MKIRKAAALMMCVATAMSMAACGGSSSSSDAQPAEQTAEAGAEAGAEQGEAAASGETIAMTLWGGEEDQEYLASRIEAFKAAYPDQTFDIQLGVESESTAKDTILTDVEAAADVFAFADDQLDDLVDAGALLAYDENMDMVLQNYAGKSVEDIKNANVAVSIEAASKNGTLYALPFTADNGYFLYYDSTVFTEDDVKSWDSLLAAAQEKGSGRKVGMTLASGWYNAGFFYGAGFTTGRNDDGTTNMDWNGTSPSGVTGVQVTQAMLGIAASDAFMAVADGDLSNQIAAGNLCAVVDGTWDASAVQTAFGDGYAATILPTYTVGDQQVQTGSVGGCKLMGVNAHCENSGWAVLLAEFLTNEESQAARFEMRGAGPSNINAQNSDAVKADVALSAVLAQSEYAVIQKVGGKYWDPAKTFGEMIAQGQVSAGDEAAVQAALDNLVEGVTAPVQ